MTEVYKEVEAPMELHVVTRNEFETWYKRFINEDEIILKGIKSEVSSSG